MKRFILALATLLTVTVSASAMSYEQARDQALFLTDKMAYELNLTDEQYEAAYEINLDYLMRIDGYDDLYGAYWRQRNMDLSYILLDWQYRAYCDASYFYRPLYFDGGYWHFSIYARYPHRDYFFFGCPNFVVTYRGGHSWAHNGGRSWYNGRPWEGPRDNGPRMGMRARFDNGRFGDGFRYQSGTRTWSAARGGNVQRQNGNTQRQSGNRTFGNLQRGTSADSPLRNRSFGSMGNGSSVSGGNNGTRSFGTPRQSSTRSTVNRSASSGSSFGSRSFGSNSTQPRNTFSPSQSSRSTFGNRSNSQSGSQTRTFSAPQMRSGSQSGGSVSRSSGSGSFGGHSVGSGAGSHSSGGSAGGGGGHFGRR